MPDQVLWTFLADDDDADLTNGTPHDYALCVAATNHGFACPEVTTGVFFAHTPLRHATAGASAYDVTALIHASGAVLDPASTTLHWRRRGGLFEAIAMAPTGATDGFSASIPIPAGTWAEIEYYLSAADEKGRTRFDPPGAPAIVHRFDVAAYSNDFEGPDDGWSGVDPFEDDATEGLWTLADPVGSVAEPEDDATPGSGVRAWITGQCGDGFDSCVNVCIEGCSDVDGGRTSLVTPRFDLSGVFAARFKYERWYSNTLGPDPGDDAWRVDISNDDGATWTNAILDPMPRTLWTTEQIDVKRFFAHPDRVRIRFVAEDAGVASNVEAGVDDFRLLTRSLVRAVEAQPGAAPAPEPEFALRPVGRPPSATAISIAFAVPARAEVSLDVFDVRGRVVRRLHGGATEAGRYEVVWDGRDGSGRPVGSGVYFARLVAADRARTEKIVVVR
jgi:hypothetical protein